jgi:hypothetical protein
VKALLDCLYAMTLVSPNNLRDSGVQSVKVLKTFNARSLFASFLVLGLIRSLFEPKKTNYAVYEHFENTRFQPSWKSMVNEHVFMDLMLLDKNSNAR